MTRWIHASLAALLGFAALASYAQTCTQTISPGADLSSTVINAAPGSVICLNPGTYNPPSLALNIFPDNGGFAIGNSVTVKGLGATPADVRLQAIASGVDHTVYFVNYVGGKTASGAQLINLTIEGGSGGVQVYNFTAPATRLTDIKLKDVVISTVGAVGFGVLLRSADRVVLDNVRVTSHNTALNIIDTTDSVVMNSTVPSTVQEAATALSVQSGSGNRFVNNSFGSPRTVAGSAYSFNGGGIVFYNTSDNRFEANTLQGMRDDALDFTAVDGVTPVAKSLNNYIGKNDIIHTAFALQGSVLGSSGIWTNCGSDGSWIYGNEIRGAAECGICVWTSRSNMVQGNLNYNNGIAGIFVSGGQESFEFCTASGGAFRQKPQYNFLQSNANYFNKNDEVVIRDAANTDFTRNFASPRNALGGTAQACTNPACQAALSIESTSATFAPSTGVRALANTSIDTYRGLWIDHTTTSGIEFYLNRTLNSSFSRFATAGTQNIDRGPVLGGNYWSNWFPSGNPSSGQPYSGVQDEPTGTTTGRVVDRYPYQSENLGRGYNITVSEPRAGSSAARGTKRTVRWDSVGCVWVDLTLGAATLRSNIPNTGYAVVTIPDAAALGSSNIVATCKDSGGTARVSANSPTFSVTDANLKLLSPGRDDVFNAGSQIWVAWKNTNPAALTSVSIDYSTDGGANWTTLATFNNQNTNPVTSARVALPATVTAYGMIRVRSGAAVDQTDGVFSVRGGSGAFTNVSAGRTFRQGEPERLEWSSPANSRLVTINATVGATTVNVATDLPDRGSFDWIMPDMGAGTLSLAITYKSITGTVIAGPVTNASSGVTRYAATITLGTPPTIGPGQSGSLAATANSGAAVTLTSSTPGVCTVSGNNVTGQANGTCTITANAGASGVYTAALPSTISFTIGTSQTITFNAPSYIAVGTPIGLTATASSGLPVSFASLTPGVCSVSGNLVTGNTVGTCIVQATQPGNGSVAAAAPVQDSINSVAPADVPRLVNISTRMQVLTGDDVMIAGFVIGGNQAKTVVVRARGPSMAAQGVPNVLANPVLQIFSGATQIAANDNWQQAANASTLQSSGFAPPDPAESAVYMTLAPGAYTGIVTGAGGATGVGLVEVFEIDLPGVPLLNIATRGRVQTGDNVMIAGFIIQGTAPQTVVIRARGPSLAAAGVPGTLANPKLQIFSGQTEIASNDDWQTAANASTLQASGFAPAMAAEAAIYITLNPGAYTAIVSGVGGATGVGIVEVFGGL